VQGDIRKARAKVLRELGGQQLVKHLATLVGKTMPVLVEKSGRGHTEYFSPVQLDRAAPTGHIVQVKMLAVGKDVIEGIIQ
jgi:tRNA A37 methylthiotransferase MiaB